MNGLVRDGAQHADERKVEKIAPVLEIFTGFIVLQAEQKREFHTQKAVFRKCAALRSKNSLISVCRSCSSHVFKEPLMPPETARLCMELPQMNASVSAMRMPSTHRTRVLCIVCFMRNPFKIFSPFYHARAGFSMLSQKFNFYMTPKRP